MARPLFLTHPVDSLRFFWCYLFPESLEAMLEEADLAKRVREVVDEVQRQRLELQTLSASATGAANSIDEVRLRRMLTHEDCEHQEFVVRGNQVVEETASIHKRNRSAFLRRLIRSAMQLLIVGTIWTVLTVFDETPRRMGEWGVPFGTALLVMLAFQLFRIRAESRRVYALGELGVGVVLAYGTVETMLATEAPPAV
ncbi:MAG: hypothetical protein QM817_40810 [Archangium sp.]